MTTTDAGFQRARRPEQKQQRQDDILAAARELALRDGVRSVTPDRHRRPRRHPQVGAAALLRDPRADPPRADGAGLAGVGPLAGLTSWTAPRRATAGLVADVVARSFTDRPLLCDLIAHTPLNLERTRLGGGGAPLQADLAGRHRRRRRGDPPGAARADRPASAASSSRPWPAWPERCGRSPTRRRRWPTLYAADPDLAHACVDLLPRLRRTAEIMLAGLIPSRPAGPGARCWPLTGGPHPHHAQRSSRM